MQAKGNVRWGAADGTNRWVCAVAKQATDQGFLITAYPTDAIKEGTQI